MSDRSVNSTIQTASEPFPLVSVLAAAAAGLALSALVLPLWLPGLDSSLTGEDIKAYWYLSRATAIIGYVFLWLSMIWGLLLTGKLARIWPGAAAASELHKFISLFGLALGGFHALLLLGDRYMNFSLVQLLLPFASQNYRPEWVGLGQLSLYLWGLVIGTFYIRKQIGQKAWRWVHYASFLTFLAILLHGIFSGSDSGTTGMTLLYWISGGSVLFLTIYRILAALETKREGAAAG